MAQRDLHEVESEAIQLVRSELGEPIRIAENIFNLASDVHSNDVRQRLSKAERVRLLLLQRLQNDLRCCIILIERGYGLQAASMAAGIYEAWVTLAKVTTEDEARKWLEHENKYRSYGETISDLTKQGLRNIVDDTAYADRMHEQYRQLCMAKHLNPIVERGRGYSVVQGGSIQFRPGPDTSELGLALGCFALQSASQFAYFALLTIVNSRGPSPVLRSKFEAEQREMETLRQECAKRCSNFFSQG